MMTSFQTTKTAEEKKCKGKRFYVFWQKLNFPIDKKSEWKSLESIATHTQNVRANGCKRIDERFFFLPFGDAMPMAMESPNTDRGCLIWIELTNKYPFMLKYLYAYFGARFHLLFACFHLYRNKMTNFNLIYGTCRLLIANIAHQKWQNKKFNTHFGRWYELLCVGLWNFSFSTKCQLKQHINIQKER